MGVERQLFGVEWAVWLNRNLLGSRGVHRIEDANLFFPEETPDVIADEAAHLDGGQAVSAPLGCVVNFLGPTLGLLTMRILTLPFIVLCCLPSLQAQIAPAPTAGSALPFTLKPLGHGVYAAIDNAKGEAGANAGFVIGDDGVAVVDSFDNPPAAQALLGEIRTITKLPIKFVINTHYHLDHVAGNAIFAKEGAVIVAHRNVPSWIHTENLKFFGKEIKPEQKSMIEHLAAPNVLYDSTMELRLGGVSLRVEFFPGHTGGDSLVIVQQEKSAVVFTGDLFWRQTLPNLIDASTLPWMETLSTLSKFSAETPIIFVPGHGDPGVATDVTAFRGYLSDLRDWVGSAKKDGKSSTALLEAVLPQVKQKYGAWQFFDYFAKRNIADVEAELNGSKRVPTPSR
jgi:glyoxylase-like metal-dependent hydrolase (beta-lactamase superfamily II)